MIKINILLNRSERDYNEYLAHKILKDIRNWKDVDLIKSSYFNKLDLVDFPNILSCFNNFLNKCFEECLVNLILLSRSSKEIDFACSNAATILAKSNFAFKDIDFSRIRIPKADLSQRLFVNVKFENSFLKEVSFLQSQFYNVNFKNCDLSCANFGYFIKMNSMHGKGISFSSDDSYFYYKNDDRVIKIDLKYQNIRNQFILSNFITTNISQIHSLRFKPSSISIHGQYIKLWDNHDKSLIHTFNMHRLVISPNWKYIAAIDANSFVLSWDIEKNRQTLGAVMGFNYRGSKLIFSSSSRYLAIMRSKSISIIETESWTLLRQSFGKFNLKHIFILSHCGQKLASGDSLKIYVIDTMTSTQTIIYRKFKKLSCLSFSHCGNFLAVGFKENCGFIIDIKSQKEFKIFNSFENYSQSVIFSVSGKCIAWSDHNGNIKIYEFSPKFSHNDCNRHLQVNRAKVSPRGAYLITVGSDKAILWDLVNFNPKQIKQFEDYNHYFDYFFSPHETYIVKKFFDKIQIYDIDHDFWLKILNIKQWTFEISFSHCENYLICMHHYSYEYYKISGLELVRKVDIKLPSLTHIRFSECGNYDFWFDSQSYLYIWDLEKDEWMKIIQIDNKYNLWGLRAQWPHIVLRAWKENENSIGIWNIDSDEVVNILVGQEKFCCSRFENSNGTLAAEAFGKGAISIWDIETKSVKYQFQSLFSSPIYSIQVINSHVIIIQKDNVEIFNLALLS